MRASRVNNPIGQLDPVDEDATGKQIEYQWQSVQYKAVEVVSTVGKQMDRLLARQNPRCILQESVSITGTLVWADSRIRWHCECS